MDEIKLSKFLSLVLRHAPERIGLRLDEAGWTGVDELLAACRAHRMPLTHEHLEQLVARSDKQRFAFDETRTPIRANQGHTIPVELGYAPQSPPEILFHGTPHRFLPSIRAQGLLKGKRHHVHLSAEEATARKVGDRRGTSTVLTVQAGAMHLAGHAFFVSANGVWLVDHVPPTFLGKF